MSEAVTQDVVVVERSYRASVSELWDLWTTKEGFESWWGPEGFRVEVHALEARQGGALVYDMIADSPEMVAAMEKMGQPVSHMTKGHYSVFAPTDRLALSHLIDFVPGQEPYETLIEVDFTAAEEEARMTITIHPHRDPHWTSMAVQGFTSQITKLDRRFGWTAA